MFVNKAIPLSGHQATTPPSARYYCITVIQRSNQRPVTAPCRLWRHSLFPSNHQSQSWRTESHDPIRRSRSLQTCPPTNLFLFFLLHASTSEPAEHITVSQSLRRFSRAESSQVSSSIENTCCFSIEGGLPERLPKVSNATCG